MERSGEEAMRSISPFLPIMIISSSSPFWPPQALKTLRELGRGRVHSGQELFQAITDLRNALSLSSKSPLAPSASHGYAYFFDQVMSRERAKNWFQKALPALANLLLKLPSLLETHYKNASGDGALVTTALRLLPSQQPGIVFLSQELIAALLACSFFCLFPEKDRKAKYLPLINLDLNFGILYDKYTQKNNEHKMWCILHYFQRITSNMPKGVVSFERKVLPYKNDSIHITYPDVNFWSTSVLPLCKFEVHNSGRIEDQSNDAVEVDFADPYLGGLIIGKGCVQEEIRFLMSPELIAGMLFLPAMADNESIEIVGAERFSSYTGYSSSFRISGEYVDKRGVDTLGRRKTRIVAIDALNRPGVNQYRANLVTREINKAFCGFLDQCKYQPYQKKLQENECSSSQFDAATSTSMETVEGKFSKIEIRNSQNDYSRMDRCNNIGVATGNWGCGVFGGDPEIKTIIQWLAASQARKPFVTYYTFGLEALQNLNEVVHWISSQKWTVGDLWKMLNKYSAIKLKGETKLGFFQWLRRQ